MQIDDDDTILSRIAAGQIDPILYSAYTRLLGRAFRRLLAYYGEIEAHANTSEGESMALYAKKLVATMKSLRLKYAFNPTYFERPGIDLSISGFPFEDDVSRFDADLATRDERLPKLPPVAETREMLLNFLMQPGTETPVRQSETARNLLWQIAERAFLERLNLRTHFLRFTPGKLFQADPKVFTPGEGRRGYHFSWGCYDSEFNQPAVYFMLFSQNEEEKSLDGEYNPEFVRFLETVDRIASRAPENLAVVASGLDDAFRALYPKALKRFRIGPLVSPLLYNGEDESTYSPLAQKLLPHFKAADVPASDYVLMFTTEIVLSDREEAPTALKAVLGKGKNKQIFHVPRTDRQLLRQGATATTRYCILPHRLRQHLSDQVLAEIPELQNVEWLVYQPDEGDIINVG